MKTIIAIIGIALLTFLANNYLNDKKKGPVVPASLTEEKRVHEIVKTPQEPQYRCDGRIHCSQMRSCDEARFFLRNCPGVKMDGDLDGIPCEDQLCQ